MVHDSPYKSSVKWQRCTLGNSSCCDQTELPSSATSTSPGLVCWNYMKLHYMKYGKYGSGQFLRKFRLSSEPSPERCRTLSSESSSFATRNCRNCSRFQCFWCRCANLRIQGSSGFSAQKSHRRQNAAPVPTNTRRRSNSPPCQKKGPNSNLIQFDLCFHCYRPFHTPIAPYTNGTAPTSCNPIAWPIHTYKSRWNLALWILQRLVAIIYYPFCYFTFSCSTDSCSKTWWKLMHLYMLPLAKLVLSRPTHTSSDHLQGILSHYHKGQYFKFCCSFCSAGSKDQTQHNNFHRTTQSFRPLQMDYYGELMTFCLYFGP